MPIGDILVLQCISVAFSQTDMGTYPIAVAARTAAARASARRLMGTVAKDANRAAVHGSRPPVTKPVEELDEKTKSEIDEKQRKGEDVEKIVNSKLNKDKEPQK